MSDDSSQQTQDASSPSGAFFQTSNVKKFVSQRLLDKSFLRLTGTLKLRATGRYIVVFGLINQDEEYLPELTITRSVAGDAGDQVPIQIDLQYSFIHTILSYKYAVLPESVPIPFARDEPNQESASRRGCLILIAAVVSSFGALAAFTFLLWHVP